MERNGKIDEMNETDKIIGAVRKHYPELQAVYLFGSYGTAEARADSDVDIAVLLLPRESREAGSLLMSDLRSELESLLEKDVDLINLRQADTVFQKEIIMEGRRVFDADECGTDEFEMLTISYYQKLNAERAEILQEISASGRVYNV